MSQSPYRRCRENLTIDTKIWYSEHDCKFHWTLIAYESDMHTGTADHIAQAMIDIERTIDYVMYSTSGQNEN